MLSTFLIVFILVGFGLPWTWLLQRRSTDATLEGFVDRICLGYAISFFVLFVSAQFRLWLFVPIWLIGVAAGIWQTVRGRDRAQVWPSLGREGWVLVVTSAIYLAFRCMPFFVRRFPLGWDAYFHMTIAESIVARGQAVHDWMPYENMPLNYPIGAHLLLALTQWLSGVRPHEFFEAMTVLFTWLSGLQLFSLGSRATGDRHVGCYAALAYWFLATCGSLAYTIWSGLPNLIGMYLFLGLLGSLASDAPYGRGAIAVFVVYLLAACFVHHHVMVTSGLCLAWTAAYLIVRGDRTRAKHVITGLIAAGVIGSPYFAIYLFRTAGLGNTGIQDYLEGTADGWSLLRDLGFGFSVASAAGVYLYFKNGQRVSSFVSQPLTAMLVLYLADEFMFRTWSQVLFDHEMAPFTPSRFITDAVALLAVYAGIFFRTMQGARETLRPALVALIIGGFFMFNRYLYRDTFKHEIARERVETYEWIREHAPRDAVLIDHDLHATYMTRRMSSSFPLPTSEYSALAVNRQLLEGIAHDREPPAKAERPVLAVVEPGAKAPPGKQLWEHPSGFRVIERHVP